MNQADDLNYNCNFYIFLIQTKLHQVKGIDRARVLKWTKKLSGCQRTAEEMKLRNELMLYLLENIQENQLKPPFTEEPPQGPLPPLANLLAKKSERYRATDASCPDAGHNAAPMQPLIYQFSPDGGAFLATQPVPRCGAFCYLAVVSREKC